jgi:tetratricopeptide (TPR) repeat protein
VDYGPWDTPAYRQWGLNEETTTETVIGSTWQDDSYLRGNLKMQSDRWYYLLFAVGNEDELTMRLWDANDETLFGEHWWLFDSNQGWSGRQWGFHLPAGSGVIEVDSLTHLTFERLPALSSSDSYYWKGQELMLIEGDVEGAISQFSSAIDAAGGDCAACYRRRGILYQFYLGDVDTAKEDYVRATDLEPENWLGYRLLHYVYIYQDDFEAAVEFADIVIDLAPNLFNGYWYRGRSYLSMGRYEAAASDFLQVTELNPLYADGFRQLCLTYNSLNDYEAAYTACTSCIDLAPTFDGCYWDRGWAADGLGDPAAAKADFETYLDLVPADVCPECQEEAREYIDSH